MSIILSASLDSRIPQHVSFTQRGYAGLTQGPVTSSDVKVSKVIHQIAYESYVKNIDIFLSATARQMDINTAYKIGLIPEDYIPTLPLALPCVVFRFDPSPKGEKLITFKAAFEKFNIQEHQQGKNTVYTLDSPPAKVIRKFILPSAVKGIQSMGKYITVEMYLAAYRLYQIADVFCATNTYPFCSNDDEMGVDGGAYNYEMQGRVFKREALRISEHVCKKQKTKEELENEEADKAMAGDSDEEEDDDEDAMVGLVEGSESMKAKPSLLPSSTCFGAPKDVPNLPGQFFSYFHGMNSSDKAFLIDITLSLFARNFASETQDYREGWKAFRKDLGTFGNTTEGLAITHIFRGFEFALQSQTQAYLIFNRGEYAGFCLLGGQWKWWSNNLWSKPCSAETLQTTLLSLRTHEDVLDTLQGQLSTLAVRPGVKGITEVGFSTALEVATALGAVDWNRVDADDKADIERTVADLRFGAKYKGIGAESLVWAIEQMTTKLFEPLPHDINLYFPNRDFGLFARKEFMVLCAFGSRAPKFWGASGSVYTFKSLAEDDPWSEIDEKTNKKKMDVILVSTAPPYQCITGWDNVVDRQALKFDIKERAGGSRNFPIPGEKRDLLWAAFRKHVVPFSVARGRSSTYIVDGKAKASGIAEISKKVDATAIDWATVDFE